MQNQQQNVNMQGGMNMGIQNGLDAQNAFTHHQFKNNNMTGNNKMGQQPAYGNVDKSLTAATGASARIGFIRKVYGILCA